MENLQPLILMGGMFLIMYLFIIRPQQKKKKDLKKFADELKKGDQIVSVGGIHGKIVEVNDTAVVIDVDRGTKITLEKSSISLDMSKKPEK